MSNPRVNSYGYTIRIDIGVSADQFTDQTGRNITLFCCASSNGGFTLDIDSSTLFVGNSTIYSSSEGLTFTSGQWVYGQTLTANSFTTADDWDAWIVASATGKHFISPAVKITVDA